MRTKRQLLERMYEPPPELLELSTDELKALGDALAKLPTVEDPLEWMSGRVSERQRSKED